MSMGDICLDSENWDDLCGMVKAAGIDLKTLAQETGAIKRRRAVRDAETLLRLGLAYGGGLGSLQTVSAWAAQAGLAHLSKVALMKRLAKAADLLIAIAGRLLLAGCKARSGQHRVTSAASCRCLVYFQAGQQGDRLAPARRVRSGPAVFRRSRSQRCQRRRRLRTLCGRTRRNPDRRPRLYLVSRLAPCPPWRW